MSRRQYTTLIVQVRIPQPAGKTQAQTLAWVKAVLTDNEHGARMGFVSPQTIVKVIGKETTYL